MRDILFATTACLVLAAGPHAEAQPSNDEVFGNAALRELHNLAIASAHSERAAKDSDRLGCREAYDSIQSAAHEALTNMHRMSFVPSDALNRVSSLLRLINESSGACPADFVTGAGILPVLAGQAIFSLRTDYAIGDADWYMVTTNGTVEARNPLRYAQSLNDQRYSWVDVRPKGMVAVGVFDWKAEMASQEVADTAIEHSGSNLEAVEVDYRKDSGDDNTSVYFFRTKAEAEAEAKASSERAEASVREAAEAKVSTTSWTRKLMSLPFMIANHDGGFKLAYAVCIDTGKNADGQNTCRDEGSHDWSDNRPVPYLRFNDLSSCQDASYKLNTNHPIGVKVDGNNAFTSYCVPAPKVSGRVVRGYKAIFALTPPGTDSDKNVYADLRISGTQTATVFKTFDACYDALDAAYSKAEKDLDTEKEDVNFVANCVRVY